MKYFFILLILLNGLFSYAQNHRIYTDDSLWLSRPKEIADANGVEDIAAVEQVPVSGFLAKDVRADTSYVGIRMKNSLLEEDKMFKKVNVERGLGEWMTAFMNRCNRHHVKKGAPQMVCFVKQLRVIQLDSINRLSNKKECYSKIRLEVEAYLLIDTTYYPALKMDTIAMALTPGNRNFSILGKLVTALTAKSSRMDEDKILKRKGYTSAQLDERYTKRFDKPILAARIFNRGVYKSFEEFIQNRPSIVNYRFLKDKKADILSVKNESNLWERLHDVFGFCDGRTIWINLKGSYRPLVKQGSTFEFIETQNYWYRSAVPSIPIGVGASPLGLKIGVLLSSEMSNSAVVTDRMAYQLNMDNGELW